MSSRDSRSDDVRFNLPTYPTFNRVSLFFIFFWVRRGYNWTGPKAVRQGD